MKYLLKQSLILVVGISVILLIEIVSWTIFVNTHEVIREDGGIVLIE
jgi:hypothetical protein